ncbi:MAG: ABC transporter ATP-binding protein [Planctomycetota bacterium]
MNAVSMKNLSKCYKIYNSPLKRLAELALPGRELHRKLWALRDIDLEVPVGQSLGIIGRNGSGKTTLLKVLMGISRQTTGEAEINGRVAALLELGAGFHPEFTGRENVFMNCAMMGMSRREAESKLDEVIEFSELRDFIDMPVKMYSSGMYVRLGFSVAMCLEPDILIVDEALSVGDEDFVNKCQVRFREHLEKKKTLLFVSHNLGIVRVMAERVVLLDEGRIIADDEPDKVADLYLERIHDDARRRTGKQRMELSSRRGNGKVRIMDVTLHAGDGREENVFRTGEPFEVRMRYEILEPTSRPHFAFVFCRNDGTVLMQQFQIMTKLFTREWNSVKELLDEHPERHPGDSGSITMRIEKFPLMPGNYFVNARVNEVKGTWNLVEEVYRAREFKVTKCFGDFSGQFYVPAAWKDEPDAPRHG